MIQTVLFVAGLNTLLQTWFGTRLPVVMGASYTFIIPIYSIVLAPKYSTHTDPHEVGILIISWPCFNFFFFGMGKRRNEFSLDGPFLALFFL